MVLIIGPRIFTLAQSARSFVANARGMGRDMMELARLEAQLAAASAISVAAFSIIALVFAVTAWILLIGALVSWIAENWLSLPAAFLIVGSIMIVAVIPCVVVVAMRVPDLTFRATRQQLKSVHHGE